jgi:hypothetical protein
MPDCYLSEICGHPAGCHRAPGCIDQVKSLAQRLGVPDYYASGLLFSGLLGYTDSAGEVTSEGIRHYQNYGTQWRTDIPPRIAPYDEAPEPAGWENAPIYTSGDAQLSCSEYSFADGDVIWQAHLYFRPNFFFFPNWTTTGSALGVPVSLPHKLRVTSRGRDIELFPDPEGRLSLLSVTGQLQKGQDPMETALEIAIPVLNRISAITDHALPIVQQHWIGFPSGTINIRTISRPRPVKLDLSDFTEFSPLKDAEALYRVGLNCNEAMYRFLSFWRAHEAIESAQAHWRKQTQKAILEPTPAIFPSHPVFGTFSGKKFGAAINELHGAYRNAIAHGGLSNKQVHSGASAKNLTKIEQTTPLIHYIAKTKIENFRHTLQNSK